MALPGVKQETFDYSRGREPDRYLYADDSELSQSDARIRELENQGYRREGNFLYAPEQEYTTHAAPKKRQFTKGTYSPVVVELDEQGRIIRETKYRVRVQEQSSSGGWTDFETYAAEVSTYDYNRGVMETVADNSRRETFLSTSQKVQSEVKQGLRNSEPIVAQRRRERELQAKRESLARRGYGQFETHGGKRGSYAGDVSIFSGSKAERAEYLKNPNAYTTKKRVQDALARSENLTQLGYRTAEDVFYGRINQNGTNIPFNRNSARDSSVSPNSLAQVQKVQREQAFQKRINRLSSWEADFAQRQQNLVKFFGYKQGGSFLRNLAPVALSVPAGFVTALPEAIAISGAKGAAAVEGLFVNPADTKAELKRAARETPGEFGRSIDPRTPEGFVNLALLLTPFGRYAVSPKFRAQLKANAFLKQVNKNPPNVQGETYFGTKTITSQSKGPVIREADGLVVEKPGVNPTEQRVIKTPYKVLTTASGERIFIAQPPDLPQVTTIRGAGNFKDFTLRTTTDPFTGVSKADVFQLVESRPTAFDRLAGFARGKNLYPYDVNLELIKTYKFKANQGLAFTEALPQLTGLQEFKLEGYTQRQQFGYQTSQGIPLSRKGLQPVGQSSLFYGERVQVGQKIPKVDIWLNRDLTGEIKVGKTEFEIVDYPVKPESAILRRNSEGFFSSKPVEFKTTAEALLKQRFQIQFNNLGQPKRLKLTTQKARSNVEKPLIGEYRMRPQDIDSFLGKPAETFNPQQSRTAAYLKEQLAKYDPYGLSGDRLRLSQVTDNLQVQRPSVKPSTRKTILRTDVIPKSRIVSNSLFTYPLNAPLQETNLNLSPIIEPASLSISDNENLTITNPIIQSEIRQIARGKRELRNEIVTRQNTRQQTRQQTKSISQLRSQNGFINVGGRILPPKKGQMPELGFDLLGPVSKQAVYDVYVYEARAKTGKGGPKRVKVNESPLPRNAALAEGGYYVDNSQSQRFVIEPAGKADVQDIGFFDTGYKFRGIKGKSKLSSKSYIEKTSYLLDSSGELRDVTVRGLLAQRRKQNLLGF